MVFNKKSLKKKWDGLFFRCSGSGKKMEVAHSLGGRGRWVGLIFLQLFKKRGRRFV